MGVGVSRRGKGDEVTLRCDLVFGERLARHKKTSKAGGVCVCVPAIEGAIYHRGITGAEQHAVARGWFRQLPTNAN